MSEASIRLDFHDPVIQGLVVFVIKESKIVCQQKVVSAIPANL